MSRKDIERLQEIAVTPRKQLGETALDKLIQVASSPDALKTIVKEARAQKPPNEAIIGAAGILAYMHAVDESEYWKGDNNDLASVAKKAFPGAVVHVEVPIRFRGSSSVGEDN